mgnify:CR=1 FL=1
MAPIVVGAPVTVGMFTRNGADVDSDLTKLALTLPFTLFSAVSPAAVPPVSRLPSRIVLLMLTVAVGAPAPRLTAYRAPPPPIPEHELGMGRAWLIVVMSLWIATLGNLALWRAGRGGRAGWKGADRPR